MMIQRPLAALLGVVLLAAPTACTDSREPVDIALITKQETNPYWVTMREVAQEEADRVGATLHTATGSSDVDVAAQRAALEKMIAEGVDGILIAPTDSTALNSDIQRARAAGITVIALDTPTSPTEATDAYFGTDNLRAGQLVGQYAKAKAAELGLEPVVAMLNLAPGIESGEARAEGFLEGIGLTATEVAAALDSQGDQDKARTLLAEALQETPAINVVYAVNEPAALGAVEALREAGADLEKVVVVAVDGGCVAMKEAVRPGDIDAVAMQFPQNMAREGVQAIVSKVRDAQAPSGYLATGTELVSGSPAPGVESKNVEYGVRTCWG